MYVGKTNDEIDESLILGHIVFNSIDDLKIHKNDLADLFDKYGISRSYLPHEIKTHDAFRRSTAQAHRTLEVQFNNTPYKAKLLVREVKCDDKKIVRHLVRELLDAKNETTDYATIGKFIFDRNTESLTVSYDGAYLTEYNYKSILKEIYDLYNEWTQYHTRDTVRNIVTRIIKSMNPVSIMQGGRAQFIPKYNYSTLSALKQVIHELPGDSVIEIIPMIDSIDQRNLISKNLEKEIMSDSKKLMEDFSEVLKSKYIRKDTVKRYAQNFVELQNKATQYESLLDQNMSLIKTQLSQILSKINDEEEVTSI